MVMLAVGLARGLPGNSISPGGTAISSSARRGKQKSGMGMTSPDVLGDRLLSVRLEDPRRSAGGDGDAPEDPMGGWLPDASPSWISARGATFWRGKTRDFDLRYTGRLQLHPET